MNNYCCIFRLVFRVVFHLFWLFLLQFLSSFFCSKVCEFSYIVFLTSQISPHWFIYVPFYYTPTTIISHNHSHAHKPTRKTSTHGNTYRNIHTHIFMHIHPYTPIIYQENLAQRQLIMVFHFSDDINTISLVFPNAWSSATCNGEQLDTNHWPSANTRYSNNVLQKGCARVCVTVHVRERDR